MDTLFTKEPEFLYVDLNGSFDLESFKAFLKRMGSEIDKAILIDGSKLENTDLSYEIRYELVIAAKEYLNEDVTYAVVWPPKDINNFIISNLNRLGVSIQIFPKLAKAKKWLQSRP